MNKLKIVSDGEKTKLNLNGVDLERKCSGFRLEQSGRDLPVLYLELICDEVDVSADSVTVEE